MYADLNGIRDRAFSVLPLTRAPHHVAALRAISIRTRHVYKGYSRVELGQGPSHRDREIVCHAPTRLLVHPHCGDAEAEKPCVVVREPTLLKWKGNGS